MRQLFRKQKLDYGWLTLRRLMIGGGGALADRETVVASGSGSADINAAITTVNAAGGGLVRLDGLMVMDGNITMKSNVILMGYGKGTGLVNSSGNAYTIDFQGTALTDYAIAGPTLGLDQFVTDAAGDAANFSQGQYVLVKDTTSTPNLGMFAKAKEDGVAGTGVVEIYGQIDYVYNAASTAAPMPTDMEYAGMMLMDVQNTGAGSIEVDIDHAHHIAFEKVYFLESVISLNEVGFIDIRDCVFTCDDTLAHARHIDIQNWVNELKVDGCNFEATLTSIDWTGATCLKRTTISNNRFLSAKNSVDLRPSSTANGHIFNCLIEGNMFLANENPASGGGNSEDFVWNCGTRHLQINNNQFFTENAISIYSIKATSRYNDNISIVGNNVKESGIYAVTCRRGVIADNQGSNTTSIYLTSGCSTTSVTGNQVGSIYITENNVTACYSNTVTGNVCETNLGFGSDAARPAYDNIISGNYAVNFYIDEDGYDNTISGNTINGTFRIGNGAGDVNDRNVITGNSITGNLVFTESDQDDCEIVGNVITGTLTYLTGTGNHVEQKGHYSIQDREIRLATGGSTEINAAITTLNTAGGGKVIFDALLDMDASITMKSNVILEGQGTGTGIRNNTGNAYTIDFQGTAPTYYGIAAPSWGNDQLVTDVAADAANFLQGEWIIVKDETTSPREGHYQMAKEDGVAGTGVVEFFGAFDASSAATSTAGPMKVPVKNSGITLMDITNTSTGSIEVDVDYCHDITFDRVYLLESTITINECIHIDILNCKFSAIDTLTHPVHVEFEDWAFACHVRDCYFENALYLIKWVGSRLLKDVQIYDSHFGPSNVAIGFEATGVTPSMWGCVLKDNVFPQIEDIGSGGGGARGLSQESSTVNCVYDGNVFGGPNGASSVFIDIPAGRINDNLAFTNNSCGPGDINIEGIIRSNITGNMGRRYADLSISRGCTDSNISGNGMFVLIKINDLGITQTIGNTITGNQCTGLMTLNSDAANPASENVISGNNLGGLTIEQDGTDNVITGNFIDGNVTIGAGAGDVNDRTIFSDNNVDGTATFTETSQQDCIVTGNATDGALTDLTTGAGAGNVHANNVEY